MAPSRREFMLRSAMAAAAMATGTLRAHPEAGSNLSMGPHPSTGPQPRGSALAAPPIKVCLFSKAFAGLDYKEMIAHAAETGFDGIDLTVRADGHVNPGRVEQDLPVVVAAAKTAGLSVPMITTDIMEAGEPYTEPILHTAASLGISSYRMGRWFYDPKKSIPSNLEAFTKRFRRLAGLNRRYSIRGECQNHSGDGFGAPVWDLWETMRTLDPRWIGVQYDVFHAVAEGAHSWPLGFDILRPHIGTLAIKDFYWKKTNDRWETEVSPLGEGMVDFRKFFALLKAGDLHGPFTIHYEYLDNVALPSKMEKIKKDLLTLRELLKLLS